MKKSMEEANATETFIDSSVEEAAKSSPIKIRGVDYRAGWAN